MNNNKNSRYIFWINDPTVLFSDGKYLSFIPTSNMTRVEQINAVTRFCIYFLLLALILGKSELWIQLPIIIIIFLVILYYAFQYDSEGLKDELYRMKGSEAYSQFKSSEKDIDFTTDPMVIESGYYDSNGKLHIGAHRPSILKKNKRDSIKYSLNEFTQFKEAKCRKPLPDNPFMNPTINDFQIEDPPEPCNADDEDIKDKITDSFNDGLFRDVGDLFERENSQRMFYTIPQINPPDQTAFANWLYKTDNICKVNQSQCLRYEDLRYKRGGHALTN